MSAQGPSMRPTGRPEGTTSSGGKVAERPSGGADPGARPFPDEGGREVAPAKAPHVVRDFRLPVRVYYEDTDAAGVVYYANYLKFMERARTEWLDAHGLPLAELERKHGVVFVVTRAEIDFRGAARLGDRLEATVGFEHAGRAQMIARQSVRRAGEVLVEGIVRLACLARDGWKPARVPSELARLIEERR